MGVPVGSRGPGKLANRPVACSWLVAVTTAPGSFHTGAASCKMRLVGFELASGKYFIKAALPAAALLPLGASVAPPNPAGL